MGAVVEYDETVETVEWMLDQVYPGQHQPVSEALPNRAWNVRIDDTLLLVGVLPEPVHVRVTAGIAADVAATGALGLFLSDANAGLWNGRAYLTTSLDPHARRAAVLQEVFFADALSRSFIPSIQTVIDNMNTLARRADHLRPALMAGHGGRPFAGDDIGLLFD
jgi:hypothetical protein